VSAEKTSDGILESIRGKLGTLPEPTTENKFEEAGKVFDLLKDTRVRKLLIEGEVGTVCEIPIFSGLREDRQTTFPQEVLFIEIDQQTGDYCLVGEIRSEIQGNMLEDMYGLSSKRTAKIDFNNKFPDYYEEDYLLGEGEYSFRARREISQYDLSLSYSHSIPQILEDIESKISVNIP
jgi:hypothetical protein